MSGSSRSTTCRSTAWCGRPDPRKSRGGRDHDRPTVGQVRGVRRGHDGRWGPVKLAEALAERAAAVRRVEQLRSRVEASARYQEGETPAEDAARLLAEADEVLDSLE